MYKVLLIATLLCLASAGPQRLGRRQTQRAPRGPPAPPKIDWGKCPHLNPTEAEKQAKAQIIQGCLQKIELPNERELNEQKIAEHRTRVAGCALESEGWFSKSGGYRYKKAEREIQAKGLPQEIEAAILGHHGNCRKEAIGKYNKPEEVIAQIQLYQACMDYYISQTCEIVISQPQQAVQPENRRRGNRRGRRGSQQS